MNLDPKVVIFLSVILLVGVVIILAINLLRRRKSGLDIEKYRTEWLKIENSLDRNNSITYQMAILSADKLLDRALRDLGVAGETMGERLKSAKPRFSNVDDIWFAHKIRNRIAHETDIKLNLITTKRALFIFKKALRELGAI